MTKHALHPNSTQYLTTIDTKILGRAIKRHRLAAGLTQTELGAGGGVTSAYVSRIEDGQRRPGPSVFARFCGKMGFTPEEVLGLDESPMPTEELADQLTRVLAQVRRLRPEERWPLDKQVMLHASWAFGQDR